MPGGERAVNHVEFFHKIFVHSVPSVLMEILLGLLSPKPSPMNDKERIIIKSAGTVDYVKGEILLNTLNITSTSLSSGVIEIQAFPESNDVVGLRDLYVSLSIGKSTINMVRDVIASGDEISGTRFVKDFYTSSYSNGSLIRE